MAEWYNRPRTAFADGGDGHLIGAPLFLKAFSDPLRHFQYRDLMIEHAGVDPECVDDAAKARLDQYPSNRIT